MFWWSRCRFKIRWLTKSDFSYKFFFQWIKLRFELIQAHTKNQSWSALFYLDEHFSNLCRYAIAPALHKRQRSKTLIIFICFTFFRFGDAKSNSNGYKYIERPSNYHRFRCDSRHTECVPKCHFMTWCDTTIATHRCMGTCCELDLENQHHHGWVCVYVSRFDSAYMNPMMFCYSAESPCPLQLHIYAANTTTAKRNTHPLTHTHAQTYTHDSTKKYSEKRKTGQEDEKEEEKKKPTNSCYVSGMSYYICNVKYNIFFSTEKEMVLSIFGTHFVKLNCSSMQNKLLCMVKGVRMARIESKTNCSGKMCDLWSRI